MSFQQNEEHLWQKKTPPNNLPSPIQRSPEARHEQQQPGRCCRALAAIFSVLSKTQHLSSPRLEKQVAELKEEARRQRELKATYKARLERTQDYIRYCLEVAKENGFLHHLSNNQEVSPSTEMDHHQQQQQQQPSLLPVDKVPCDPLLADVFDQAKLNGWYIEPEEIELQEKIGEGTTADIYRGTWRGVGVAVKWIHPAVLLANGSSQAWFAQELHILSRQRHPNVLRLMGACFRTPEKGWVVMELLTGKTLSEWLHGHKERRLRTRSVPLPPLAERVEKALEIARAMQYLHQQKPTVIHRDLKPSNILMDDAMRVRVADFGHARFLADGEEALTGEMGTYVYMAPEVIRCEPYTEKCDVYSFGVILNELITGEQPYIETSYGPCKIALEVSEGRLRPKLPEDGQYKELIDLICSSWHEDAASRPSFAIINLALRKILDELKY
ncbi:serine/threonine-protein kinase STY17-like [Canna indica]|uniref:Serine/threonine-protein kinase STY17-like n=1 Tax=Canna indica TaxID=4628 RepID=A0AAQ3JMS6_9LILI|nr:serine/threonine-protein kinase STY17-like [Canna indica]